MAGSQRFCVRPPVASAPRAIEWCLPRRSGLSALLPADPLAAHVTSHRVYRYSSPGSQPLREFDYASPRCHDGTEQQRATPMQRAIQPSIRPLVLSGGSGTRLWPLSRAMYPKQFIRSFEDQGSSFLAATLRRLAPTVGFAAPVIVCNNDHRFLVKEEAELAGCALEAIVLEPVARNTAPAVAVAALLVARDDPNAILVVMPSDHVIKDEAAFVAAVRRAAEVAATGRLVLFGVTPTTPHTGYGYIRRGDPLRGFADVFVVDAFMEKPTGETAAAYLNAGGHYWNSGIFVFRARDVPGRACHSSSLGPGRRRARTRRSQGGSGFPSARPRRLRAGPEHLHRLRRHGADQDRRGAARRHRLERCRLVVVAVGDCRAGCRRQCHARRRHSGGSTRNCYVHSERALVATLGVKDLVIVDTPDALLVADRARAQDVSASSRASRRPAARSTRRTCATTGRGAISRR